MSTEAQAANPLTNIAAAIAVNLDMDHLPFEEGERSRQNAHRGADARTWLNDSDSDHIATISLCRKSESADTDNETASAKRWPLVP